METKRVKAGGGGGVGGGWTAEAGCLVPCSRITWLIALLYLSVTDSHAYFSVPKDFDCLHSCWGCNKWSRGQSGV